MKTKSLVAILAALCFGLSAYAETPREELVHAFYLLKKANHDYGGHREKAVKEVQTAAHQLGLEMGGDVPEGERQWKSDAQITEARRLLREAAVKLEQRDRDRVSAHVDKAVSEIDAALKIK